MRCLLAVASCTSWLFVFTEIFVPWETLGMR